MLTKDNITGLASLIDDLLKFKGILEMIDGPALKIGISALDSNLLDKINPEFHAPVNEVVALIVAGNYPEALNKAGDILAQAIDTPLIDGTPEENEAYRTALNTLYAVIYAIVTKDTPAEDE